jgi:hypothetical protein
MLIAPLSNQSKRRKIAEKATLRHDWFLNVLCTYKLCLVQSCLADNSEVPEWPNNASNIQVQPIVAMRVLHVAYSNAGLRSTQGDILLRASADMGLRVRSRHDRGTER